MASLPETILHDMVTCVSCLRLALYVHRRSPAKQAETLHVLEAQLERMHDLCLDLLAAHRTDGTTPLNSTMNRQANDVFHSIDSALWEQCEPSQNSETLGDA